MKTRWARRLGGVFLGLTVAACGSSNGDTSGTGASTNPPGTTPDGGTDPVVTPASGIYFLAGTDLSPAVADRARALLAKALKKPVIDVTDATLPASLTSDALVLSFGKSTTTSSRITAADLTKAGAEGYVVRSGSFRGGVLVAVNGNPKKDKPHGNLGVSHGVYAALEELGFGFLHPLAPTVPAQVAIPQVALDRTETPRWDKRTIHLHTQHPLELTEMLQGMGTGSALDKPSFEALLPEWDRFLEWCVANGENGVEWFLLWASSFSAFADSDERIARLGTLVSRAHDFGIDAGVDAPIAFQQQHSFRLLRTQGQLANEIAEIDTRLDWLMKAGWDFLGIEAGTSEFTHPTPDRMLAWMNEVAKHLDEKHGGTRAFIKVHCSTGQPADGYVDPDTGKTIGFNQLPMFADARLGVLPHTVEAYGLTDPAPTYGNTDFGYMREFLKKQAGSRPVAFYPESAYWVSVDIDTPLFLPIYADRRLSDLRLLAGDEDNGLMGTGAHKGAHMDGQMVFSSGWEWGYWLNDVVAARAAWNPHTEATSQEAALRTSLAPVARMFGAAQADVTQWLVDVVTAEQALLIDGKVAGKKPSSVVMKNGLAYISGFDTWDDVSKTAAGAGAAQMTQPDRLGLVDLRNPLHGGPGYTAEVDPLLTEMETTFATLAARGDALRAKIPAASRELFDDLADAMDMTALRAKQVHGLYDYVDGYWDTAKSVRLPRLQSARDALDAAAKVVKAREPRYRVPADRIAGWRPNPTAYAFGYLWSVRSLYYFWRDEGKAVDAPLFPCYENIINPVDVAFGEGMGTDAARFFGDFLSTDQQRGCLAEPSSEPTFPQDNLRTRP
jgi:hypothetical protein